MTWAIHSIIYRDLGDEDEAARLFVKGYDSYVRGAFKTWHEGCECLPTPLTAPHG